jgi:hypothetical protein
MKIHCIQNLLQIKELICNMKEEDFSKKLEILSGSSIGQHLRHILELYQCLLDGSITNEVNYDNRKRNLKLENDPAYVLNFIEEITDKIIHLKGDKMLTLFGSFTADSDNKTAIMTSIYRELAYNLEHSIHHQALIKIGLSAMGLSYLVDSDFGVAPATIKYQNSKKIESVEAS